MEAALTSLRAVRGDATLSAWFTSPAAGVATRIAGSSTVIGAMVDAMMAAEGKAPDGLATQWMVRVMLSLLALPGADEAEERRLLERFVVPVVAPAGRAQSMR